MQVLLVVATVALCGIGFAQAQQGVDPAYLRQYYQQLQQQQQQQQPHDGTPIYEQNSEQTQQYVSAGQQIRLKDTVSEQIRAQQQQGYVAPAVRDYLQQPQYQSQPQQAVYRQPQPAAAPPQPPRRIQPAYQQASPLLNKGHKLQHQQQQQQQHQQQAEEEEQYDDFEMLTKAILMLENSHNVVTRKGESFGLVKPVAPLRQPHQSQ
ncbi:putative cyclin-dependent serine/threonine-protein kinase DDB_G0272797/DDB_G0274007 [Drosophila busckii]|uniref:putative cyclin-dependent serine/threonine-protein kinase DDB_G0272797/DDB_G0274007 n=1 Tax=Drosophila busckii TaxID=30019 RepID=UPI001432ACCE|nr:putative cyclin-dependent serine/threonine-protein kinase DDB_G0272797/DDB_G0274007 [Drosophila busckii]